MKNETGRLFVVPLINTMGPVIDSRYEDLLNRWDQVDKHISNIFNDSYRNRFLDSEGNPLVLSWFFISWSGFKTNPVKRDIGWYTIYDHYHQKFGKEIEKFGDGIYWMYNHPPASGIANEWGLDWLNNSHYFEILNRYIIERNYFPSVIEVVTEKNDASNWIENWIPFDFSNRNVDELDLDASQEEGKKVSDVLDWRGAPTDWQHYNPSHEDYRLKGTMSRFIFRVLDIKTRIYQLNEKEIEKAFVRCMNGNDTVIAAYEHDFRDRSETIMDYFIKPIVEMSKKFPKVKWSYTNALEGAQKVCGYDNASPPSFDVKIIHDGVRDEDEIRIQSSKKLFGIMPYVVVKNLNNNEYIHHTVDNIGFCIWQIDRKILPDEFILGVASSDTFGNVGVQKFQIKGRSITKI